MLDLTLAGGTVVDGTGAAPVRADVGIRDGTIVAVGDVADEARTTIDVSGLIVSPGFVDNHCHFDAQVTWDPLCSFSPQHGATRMSTG